MTDNTADLGESGGAGGNIRPGDAVKALNTIVSGGNSTPGAQNCSGLLVSVGHNIDSRDQCGFSAATDKKNTDPLLGPLQDNGGPAKTRAITTDSPAFDAGSGDLCPATDERGAVRPQAAACDIGAFELEFADLGLAQTATPARLPVGATVTFTLTATDGGAGTAHATSVVDTLPAGLAVISATPSSGTCSGATTVSCATRRHRRGRQRDRDDRRAGNGRGPLVNAATASSPTNDPNLADNTASASVTIDAAVPQPLRLTGARISPATFRKGSKLPRLSRVRTGTTISFTLSEPATVRFAFARRKPGRRTRFAAAVVRREGAQRPQQGALPGQADAAQVAATRSVPADAHGARLRRQARRAEVAADQDAQAPRCCASGRSERGLMGGRFDERAVVAGVVVVLEPDRQRCRAGL